MGAIEDADARLGKACKTSAKAFEQEAQARAEWARVKLLDLAERSPAIQGYSFQVEWEYDDEGSYFPVVNIYADLPDEQPEGQEIVDYELAAIGIEDELSGIGNNLGPQAVEFLEACHTVEEFKEARF